MEDWNMAAGKTTRNKALLALLGDNGNLHEGTGMHFDHSAHAMNCAVALLGDT